MTLTFPVCPWVFAKKNTKIGLYFHFFPGWVRDSENEVQRDNLGAIWGFSGSFPIQVLILLPKHYVSHSPKSIQPSYPHITYLTASKELGSDLQNEKRGELLFSQKTTFRFVKRPFSQVSFFLPGSITVSAYFFIYKWHKKLVCNIYNAKYSWDDSDIWGFCSWNNWTSTRFAISWFRWTFALFSVLLFPLCQGVLLSGTGNEGNISPSARFLGTTFD